MSAMTTYVATDPAGLRHERKAEATVYTHLVMILPSLERDRDMARRLSPSSALADSREAEVLARVDRGYYRRWQFMGWCTSIEHAQRLADQQRGHEKYDQVVALPVTAE